MYNHLRQHGFSVFVGNVGGVEVDFVAERGTEKLYVQVAYLIADESVFEREFGNLLRLRDNFPKYVVSLDEVLIQNYE